jgi:hypothetical protein
VWEGQTHFARGMLVGMSDCMPVRTSVAGGAHRDHLMLTLCRSMKTTQALRAYSMGNRLGLCFPCLCFTRSFVSMEVLRHESCTRE